MLNKPNRFFFQLESLFLNKLKYLILIILSYIKLPLFT